jgi:modification methylase
MNKENEKIDSLVNSVVDSMDQMTLDGNRLIKGDVVEEMKKLSNNSVHLIVTSPPYPGATMWDEIWSGWTFEQQHDWLESIWKESHRILAPGGRLVVNIMDVPISTGVVHNSAETTNRCLKLGFALKENIIWDKGRQHMSPSGSWPSPWGILISCTHEYILVFRKDGKRDTSKVSKEVKDQSKLTTVEHPWKSESVWKIKSASAKKEKHIAPFPEEIPYRCIRLWSFVGDIVLDPFVGSGTTCVAAKNCGRKYIGIDISQEYIDLAEKNLSQKNMFDLF